MPVVDIHPHIVSPDIKRYPLAPLGGTQSTWSSERPTTYEMLLKEMNAVGVDKAAIVHSSTAYGYDNSYVADAVATVPSRFTGVYSIDVLASDAVKTFDYWLARGCGGMRLFTTGSTLRDQSTWFADPMTYPFWEHAAAKSIPVCMHFALAKYEQVYLKVTPINISPKSWGNGAPETFFRKVIDATHRAVHPQLARATGDQE